MPTISQGDLIDIAVDSDGDINAIIIALQKKAKEEKKKEFDELVADLVSAATRLHSRFPYAEIIVDLDEDTLDEGTGDILQYLMKKDTHFSME